MLSSYSGRTAQVFDRLSSLLNEPAGFIDEFRRDLLAPQKDFHGQGLLRNGSGSRDSDTNLIASVIRVEA